MVGYSEKKGDDYSGISSQVEKLRERGDYYVNRFKALQKKGGANESTLNTALVFYKHAHNLLADYESKMRKEHSSLNDLKQIIREERELRGIMRSLEGTQGRIGRIKSTRSRLEGRVASKIMPSLSIASFVVALVFLSLNLTGAVIGSISPSGSKWVSLGLMAFGIVLALVYFRWENGNLEEKTKLKR